MTKELLAAIRDFIEFLIDHALPWHIFLWGGVIGMFFTVWMDPAHFILVFSSFVVSALIGGTLKIIKTMKEAKNDS